MENYGIIIITFAILIVLIIGGKYLLLRKSKVNSINNRWAITLATTHHADVNDKGQLIKIKKQIDQRFPWLGKIQSLIKENNIELIHGGGVLGTEDYYRIGESGKSKDREIFLYLVKDAKAETSEVRDMLINIKMKHFDEKETLDDIVDPSTISWMQKEIYPVIRIIELFRFK